ncbi:FimB/Mfa2 family fimbrial subunit [Dysgonomonas sp. BGC7]|uniref:FimB/Mfa2 family fimbrial subunit n=1 Tax=Dysgonomonas sp. BGC7 TaxID=1658008 RepID=UPI000680BB2B|nr:FimB/Mfa2 family fimbrial subunit [Dysgonomonas sp. BGC7]MBD8387780.1 FimB/Mfa2 family fimbrial subunit [Dysgonomonas sp. BGC7]
MKLSKILLLLAIAAMTSCTIVDLEDPLKGKITLVADWSKRTTGIEEPTSYSVIVNNQTLNYTQPTNLLPELNTGTYPIYIYNTPDKTSIAGTTVTVATTNNQIDPLPGWLFTATTQAIYADFKEETITATMQQQVRQLTITLKPEGGTIERITGISAILSGIAGTWDFKANKPVGNAMNVPLTFTKQDNGTWQATVRLLGITGTQQILTGTVTFEGGSPTDITLDSDLSAIIAKFNTDKITPLSLQGDMKETLTELGFVTSVTDWVRVDESVVAE